MDGRDGWRVVAGVPTAWFEASSLVEAAALAGRLLQLPDGVAATTALDVRATGLRVRLGSAEHAVAVTAAAREAGLRPDPGTLQQVTVGCESADPTAVAAFWRRVLGYDAGAAATGALRDPLDRDPALGVRPSPEPRPHRGRMHLDVVRPAETVAGLGLGDGSGPYGVRHVDPDGTEVDLVPGDPLGDGPGTADWRAVFAAVAVYRTTSAPQQRDLLTAVADLADAAGFPLLVDVRPGVVVLDTGKDMWDPDAHGLDVDVVALAARAQALARDLGATADPGAARFVQLFLDAADVAAVRGFWATALGYERDPREGLTDLLDPRRLGPELVLQPLEASDVERRAQRDRLHVGLAVPVDAAPQRLATALAAGARLLEGSERRWRLADPEGNELVLTAG